MSSDGSHPSELAWAKYLARESRWLARWRHRRHLASCERCRQLEAEMAEERRSFDADPLRRDDLALLRARVPVISRDASPKAFPPRRWWMIAAGVAAAAVAAITVHVPAPPPPGLIQKGGDVFALHVERRSGAVALGPSCIPGDRIIGSYRTERSHLLVLERDGRGRIQILVPTDGAVSMKLPAAEGTTSASWILDAVPGRECFAAFFSDEPLGAAAAARAFDESHDTPAVPGATVRVQCCEKGAPR